MELNKFLDCHHTTVSSSQQAAHVQEVACGCSIPSSIKHCKALPPYRTLLFQSLLLARPHTASNSLGVYQFPSILMHLPLPPEIRMIGVFYFTVITLRMNEFSDTVSKRCACAHKFVKHYVDLKKQLPDPNLALCNSPLDDLHRTGKMSM